MAGTNPPVTHLSSIVELGRHFQAVALRLVVVDPELGFFLGKRVGYLLHGGQRLLLAEVDRGNPAVVPIAFEMNGIAGQNERAGMWQFYQQRLMTRRVSGGREDGDAAVAEYVMVAFQFCYGMRGLEPRLVVGAGPFVFGFLDVEHGGGKNREIED